MRCACSSQVYGNGEGSGGFPAVGRGGGELFHGPGVSVLQDEKFWKLVAQQCDYT